MKKLLVVLVLLGLLVALGWWSGSQPHLDAVAAAEESTGLDLESSFVDVGDVQLHVVQAGARDGPPIVLLHGFPEFWYAWRDVIPPLVAAGFRVIVPDQRGYGDSSKPDDVDAYKVDLLGDDIAGLVGALGSQKACVVAHDWGGGVAWNLALRHPDSVSRLVVLDTPHPDSPRVLASKEEKVAWYRTFFQLPWIPEFLSRLFDWTMVTKMMRNTSELGAFPDAKLAQYRSAWDRNGAYGKMVNWYRANSGPRHEGPLRRVSLPTLILVAPNDAFIPGDLTRASLQILDDGRLVELSEGTHWVVQERPDLVAQEVISFCGTGASGTSADDPETAIDPARMVATPGRPAAALSGTSLDRADEIFRAAYEAAASDALEELPMALVAVGDRISVYENGKRTAAYPYTPPVYEQLKNVAHAGLATWSLLEAADGGPVTGETQTRARALRMALGDSLENLDGVGFSAEQIPRQRELLTDAISMLDRMLAGEAIDAASQEAFARKVAPLQLANASEAARTQLVELNETVKKILEGTTDVQRERLHVVVAGVHQAREDNAQMQYFRRVLEEPGPVEHRVIYAEGVFDEAAALALLERHLLDSEIGRQFFDARARLQADILGPAAETILPTLELPSLPTAPAP